MTRKGTELHRKIGGNNKSSSITLRRFVRNLKDSDLHFENAQITQCVFLGVLRLKPVPAVFDGDFKPDVKPLITRTYSRVVKTELVKEEPGLLVPKVESAKSENRKPGGRITRRDVGKVRDHLRGRKVRRSLRSVSIKMEPAEEPSSELLTQKKKTYQIINSPKKLLATVIKDVPVPQDIAVNPVHVLFNKMKQKKYEQEKTDKDKKSPSPGDTASSSKEESEAKTGRKRNKSGSSSDEGSDKKLNAKRGRKNDLKAVNIKSEAGSENEDKDTAEKNQNSESSNPSEDKEGRSPRPSMEMDELRVTNDDKEANKSAKTKELQEESIEEIQAEIMKGMTKVSDAPECSTSSEPEKANESDSEEMRLLRENNPESSDQELISINNGNKVKPRKSARSSPEVTKSASPKTATEEDSEAAEPNKRGRKRKTPSPKTAQNTPKAEASKRIESADDIPDIFKDPKELAEKIAKLVGSSKGRNSQHFINLMKSIEKLENSSDTDNERSPVKAAPKRAKDIISPKMTPLQDESEEEEEEEEEEEPPKSPKRKSKPPSEEEDDEEELPRLTAFIKKERKLKTPEEEDASDSDDSSTRAETLEDIQREVEKSKPKPKPKKRVAGNAAMLTRSSLAASKTPEVAQKPKKIAKAKVVVKVEEKPAKKGPKAKPAANQRNVDAKKDLYEFNETEEEEDVVSLRSPSKSPAKANTSATEEDGPAKKRGKKPKAEPTRKPNNDEERENRESPAKAKDAAAPALPSTSKSVKQPSIRDLFNLANVKKERQAEIDAIFARPADRSMLDGANKSPLMESNNFEFVNANDDSDYDDDTQSYKEWMPEDYAEYKMKFTAKKSETYKPIYKCKVCLVIFPSYYMLNKHKEEHRVANPYTCQICHEAFDNVADYSAHLRVHKGKEPYVCKKCHKGFQSKQEHDEHAQIHILRKAPTGEKRYRCETCGKEFGKPCDMERHMRVHTGEKPNICNICHKRFQQAYNLSKHLVTHLNVKPFLCEICNKTFGRTDVLNRHLLTHSLKKPFKCPFCPKEFIRQIQRTKHVNANHKELGIKVEAAAAATTG